MTAYAETAPQVRSWRGATPRPTVRGDAGAAKTQDDRLAPVKEQAGQVKEHVEAVQGQVDSTKGRAAALKARLERYAPFRVLESAGIGFAKDQVPVQAAAMTYYGIFSLFPLLLLFMSLAGLALQSNEQAQQQILDVVTGLLPQGQDRLKDVIAGVIAAKGAAAGVGLLALLWGALGWFQAIDTNVNRIWGVSKSRSFVKGKLFALAMVAAVGGVALTSFAATAAINVLAAFTTVIPGSVLVWQAAVSALSVLTIVGVFYVLYRYAPQRHVQWRDIWAAALATALLWEATRRLLAFYLEKNNMISGYGPVGAAMALLFWLYIASVIVLIGAELAYAVAKERRGLRPGNELQVIAPPGEQPSPKFAHQVGEGTDIADPGAPQPDAPRAGAERGAGPATDGAPVEPVRPTWRDGQHGAAAAPVELPEVAGVRHRREGPSHGVRAGTPRQPARGSDGALGDRTTMVTVAVTGAALAGSMLLGALHGRRR